MRNKWFWGTLAFWVVFAAALTGRALIYSDLRFDPKVIGRYDIRTNGLAQSRKLWVNEGSLGDLVPLVDDRLRREGWASCAGGRDLIPDLLQLEGLVPDISDRVQLKMFQKPGFHLALGLLQATGEPKTYGWEGVFPDAVFDLNQARKGWDLPFPVPPDAKQLVNEKLENLQIALVILAPQKDLIGRFQDLCRKGNWETAEWKSGGEGTAFLLTQGSNKLLAVLSRQSSEDVITLLKFEKRKDLL
jgi:hypothetical protein